MQSSKPNDRVDTSDAIETRVSFRNGHWLPHQQLSIGVDDIGFRQGVVAVERMRTYHHAIFALPKHLERWDRTTATLGIARLPSSSIIEQHLQQLFDRNRNWIDHRGDVGITMVATPGQADDPTLMLHLNPLDHDRIEHRRRHGQPLRVTPVVQPDCASWPRTIKTRARIHYHLADHHARDLDADAVGVLLDQDGSVTETSIANLAIVDDGCIVSPPANRVLGGITQQVVERLATELKISWEKRAVSANQLSGADEVLLMGTDGGIWFGSSVDGHPIGGGAPGPVYQRLRERFDAMTRSSK